MTNDQQKPGKPESDQGQKPLNQGLPREKPVDTAGSEAGQAPETDGLKDGADQPPQPVSQRQKPPRPETTMHSDKTIEQKPRGRLTRDAMKIIGKTLEAYYEDVRNEGTPERFKQLLQQFDERKGLNDKESG